MRFWMTGIFASTVTGLIWVALWQLVLTMTAILTTGAALPLQLGPAALAGLLTALFAIMYRPAAAAIRRVSGILLLGALLIGLSMGTPFDPQSVLPAWQRVLLLLILAIAGWMSIEKTLAAAPAGRMQRYAAEEFYLRLLWGLGLMMFVLIVALPFYVMFMTSLKSQQSLLQNPLDFSIDLSIGFGALFRSYIELFADYDFGTLLLNSTLVSVVTVLVTLLFSVPGAYAVAKLRFPGRQWLSGSVLLIYLIPAIILVIPLYAVFSQLGLRNSLLGLCIVYPATTIPVALYVFMIAWNEFLFAFMFLDDVKLFTLSRGIVSLNSSEVPRQHLMAGAVIATAPVMFIFLWFERFLVSGLTAGSVKG